MLHTHLPKTTHLLHSPSLPGCLQATYEGLLSGGLQRGAGDGARTRESLLGRQGVTLSPLVCHELALLAHVDDTYTM